MANGRIVEQGTHENLMNLGSIYSEMVRQQSVQDGLGHGDSDERAHSSQSGEKARSQLSSTVEVRQGSAATSPSQKVSTSIWGLARFVYGLDPNSVPLILGGLGFSVVAGASHPT